MRKQHLLAVFIAVFGFSAEGASLIVNGSFETAPSIAQYVRLNAPSTAISGWTVEQGNIDWIRSLWQNQDGDSSLDLSGSRAGAIIQTVNLSAGVEYTLTFYMSGNPVSGPTTKRLTVGVGQYEDGAFVPGTFAEGQFVYDTAAEGNTLADMKWQRMTFTFTAIVPNTTIGFFSETNTAYGPALDNVSLAGVPEPGLPILFATLLLALPLGRRFLKK